ncbi:hypothetical protein Tco_0007059 [Tanacetum coccineum]
MDDNRTMAQLLEAPTEGYEDAIVVPEITANNFEIKHGLLNLVQNKQFFGHDKEDPHAHIRYFNKITSTMKFPNVPRSDFLMEEIDEFLERDDSIPPGVDGIYDSEGDTVYLEELLSVINSDPNLPPSPVCEINVPEKVKSSCEDPPDLELKDLPSIWLRFLEGDDKLPYNRNNLKDEDKTGAYAWKISDIKGLHNSKFAPIRFFDGGKCQTG